MTNVMPAWLRRELPTHCACGGLIEDNDNFTFRKCTNRRCPYHMAAKVEALAKYFNVKNVGMATALDLVQRNKLRNHLEALKYFFQEKPTISLQELCVVAMIPNHVKDIQQYAAGISSFRVYIGNTEIPEWVEDAATQLASYERYFTIKPPMARRQINVMVTGSFRGYPSRDAYIDNINNQFGQYIYVNNVGVRKTGVDFIICEEDAVWHNKLKIANERGIPRVTPNMFLQAIMLILKEEGVDVEREVAGIS